MILSPDGMTAVSSWGNGEKGHLRVFRASDKSSVLVEVPGADNARFTVVFNGEQGRFTALHSNVRPGNDLLTVHAFDAPADPVGHTVLAAYPTPLFGEGWQQVAQFYHAAGYLIALEPENQTFRSMETTWFDGRFDHGYQQPLYPVLNEATREILIGVQRSSTIHRLDPRTGKEIGTFVLAERYGNPELEVTKRRGEIWTVDYDTVVRLEAHTYESTGTLQVQAPIGSMWHFAGDLSFSKSEGLCAVSRPYSGDVVLLDPVSLQVVGAVGTNHQPLRQALFSDGTLITRDWKTGAAEWHSLPPGVPAD